MIGVTQPTFLPYPGYFGYINTVNNFVFLDDVQFAKRSWQQRNYICINKKKHLLTVPVISKHLYDQKINGVSIVKETSFYNDILLKIKLNYGKHKYFDSYYDKIINIFKKKPNKLIELNLELINFFINVLDIKTKLHFSSNLKIQKKKSDLILEICKIFNEKDYLSTLGSKNYLIEKEFFKKKINVHYFEFIKDVNNPLDYSILDLIFSLGPESKKYIEKNFKVI